MKRILAGLLAAAVCCACGGCARSSEVVVETAASETSGAGTLSVSQAEMFTDRDYEIGYSDETVIALSGDTASCDGSGVAIDGGIITITQEGTYLLTGTLDAGQVIVEAPDSAKLQLVLDGASITCAGQAAIYIRSADKVFLTTAKGSENLLCSTGDFSQIDDNNVDGAIFSKSDLTLNGSGLLQVACETAHGVVTKDDLAVTSGSYVVTSAKQGFSGKDSVRIAGGTIQIESGTDGIHSENTEDTEKGFVYLSGGTIEIVTQSDGVDASGTITVADAELTVTAGSGAEEAQALQGTDDTMTWRPGGIDEDAMTRARDGQMPQAEQLPRQPREQEAGQEVLPQPQQTNPQEGTQNGTEQSSDGADTSCKGIKSDAGIEILDGTFVLNTADDALHSNGAISVRGGGFSITAGDDGVHADDRLEIEGGTFEIGRSYEGLEAAELLISGGDITLTASDDGLNAAGGNDGSGMAGGMDVFRADASAAITISGGKLNVTASGDGIDSNGSLIITDGEIYVNLVDASGNGMLDYGTTGVITGGTVAGLSSGQMEVNFSDDSTQGAILYSFSQPLEEGTTVTLCDSDGAVLFRTKAEQPFQTVLLSLPELERGKCYTLTAVDQSLEIEMTDTIYGAGSMMGGGMGRGAAGGMGGSKPEGGRAFGDDGIASQTPQTGIEA